MPTQQSMIHRKYHGKTGYLLRNVDAGIGEFTGMGYRVDDVQMTQTIKSQLMTSCGSRTKLTEFRQPLQVQSHLEMPRILVQLGHIQRT